MDSPSTYSAWIDGLRSDYTYKFRAVAEDIGHADDEQGFGLLDAYRGYPYFEVDNESAFPEDTSATLQGDLVDLAPYDSAECYFEYGVATEGFTDESGRETHSSTGIYEITVSTQPDTSYVYRAVAEAPDGTVVRGGEKTFQTEDDGTRT